MKIKLIFLCMFLSFTCFGQKPTNRYYPPLKNLMPFDTSDKKMSEDFKYFDTWLREITEQTFYKDLQTSSSPRGDATFYSLGLIFKNNNEFTIGNSGIQIIVNKGKEDFSYPVNIKMQEKYKILAYLRSFDPNNYDVEDFKSKFSLGLIILNITQEQAMANILNNYFGYESNSKSTNVQKLIKDLSKEAKIKIEIDEKNDEKILSKIVTQIYTQTERYSSDVLYDIYIKSKDKKKEQYNFDNFFKSFSSEYYMSEFIDKTISYEANLNISNKDISVIFPQDIIQTFRKSDNEQFVLSTENLEIKPELIEMKSINTIGKKCIELTLLTYKSDKDQLIFKVLEEIKLNKHPFLTDNKRNLEIYKVNKIDKVIFSIYESRLEIEFRFNDVYEKQIVVFDKPFTLSAKNKK